MNPEQRRAGSTSLPSHIHCQLLAHPWDYCLFLICQETDFKESISAKIHCCLLILFIISISFHLNVNLINGGVLYPLSVVTNISFYNVFSTFSIAKSIVTSVFSNTPGVHKLNGGIYLLVTQNVYLTPYHGPSQICTFFISLAEAQLYCSIKFYSGWTLKLLHYRRGSHF